MSAKIGRPPMTETKKFYAQRLPKATIAILKALAKRIGCTEAEALAEAIVRLDQTTDGTGFMATVPPEAVKRATEPLPRRGIITTATPGANYTRPRGASIPKPGGKLL